MKRVAVIMLDLDVPEGHERALSAALARWEQGVRYAVAEGCPAATVEGACHVHAEGTVALLAAGILGTAPAPVSPLSGGDR